MFGSYFGSRTVTTRFEPVKWSEKVRVHCRGGCGKKYYRTVSVEHTINPFNKNKEGEIKTREEVRADVKANAAAEKAEMLEKGIVCAKCSNQ